jgi:hypothetical protein
MAPRDEDFTKLAAQVAELGGRLPQLLEFHQYVRREFESLGTTVRDNATREERHFDELRRDLADMREAMAKQQAFANGISAALGAAGGAAASWLFGLLGRH